MKRLDVANVNRADSQDFATRSGGRDVLCHAFRLFDVASNYACVGSEMDQSPNLGGTDAAVSAGTEDDLVVEDAISPYGGEVFMFLERHCGSGGEIWGDGRS